MSISRSLVFTPLPDMPMIQPGDDLVGFIVEVVKKQKLEICPGDIFVLAQKIVSKAENRFVNLASVQPSEEARRIGGETEKDPRFVELVLRESSEVLRTRPGTLIVEHKQGFVCANAGIDHSNVQGLDGNQEDWVLLLPEAPDHSAERIREGLEKAFSTQVGVLIIDSHGRAWRQGTVGVAIGLSGMPALVDMRGEKDLLGYTLRVTQVAAADELAAGASLIMGQAAEGTPVVHVRGFPFPLREGNFSELQRPKELDMFR